MPPDSTSGMALVLVQHLAPDHKSLLAELIRRYTEMKVCVVQDGMQVMPNCTYIIPPNRDMALMNGKLQLLERSERGGVRMPIDFFFRTLAQDQQEQAICIVLSGSGSDGTLGLREVNGEGGLAVAQDPNTTEFDQMPKSAIATGLVDYVLAPADMPPLMLSYVDHAFTKRPEPDAAPGPDSEQTLNKICLILRARTGHDFSQYKSNTLVRRIERRMAMHQIERTDQYLRFLRKTEPEVEALFGDLLIGVTSFFRDPEAFEVLEQELLPALFAKKAPGDSIRVWTVGCSTGEEAYAIAILLYERMEHLKLPFNLQVFATDIDPRAIAQARSGIFPTSSAADLSPQRLERFFVRDPEKNVLRVQKFIRDLLVFSEQDVARDPPFSRIDLVSCRNLLIYMNPALQKKLLRLFHYALHDGGLLFLGSSETVGEPEKPLFSTVNRQWKVYRRQVNVPNTRGAYHRSDPPLHDTHYRAQLTRDDVVRQRTQTARDLTEQALLLHHAQVGVLVNGRGEVLFIHGRTGKYLEPTPGNAAMNILAMAREGLRRELTTALHRVATHHNVVSFAGLRVRTNGHHVTIDLTLTPVLDPTDGTTIEDAFLVVIEQVPDAEVTEILPSSTEGSTDVEHGSRLAILERELGAKEDFLQSTLEEMESSNEELRSTNEEMQSVNEELQSTNEELETSKEELQSVNEELATVNAENQARINDLSRANNDMNNLLAGTGIGTLFVDSELKVSRFTPATLQVINLIEADVGRPLEHTVTNLEHYDHLVPDVQSVLDTLIAVEREVQTKDGAWYLMHIRPYRTLDNIIDGVVLTFVDITASKHLEEKLTEVEAFTRGLVHSLLDPLAVLDGTLRVVGINRLFTESFNVTVAETVGQLIYDLGNRQWNIPALRTLLEEILPKHKSFDGYEVSHVFEKLGQRTMSVDARRITREDRRDDLILLTVRDITPTPDGR